ncbi:phenylacetate--CoA ligase family protein [Allobranchiibius sp. GilTou73]|uniref:phenylacetate--CoA ligase family protein n=1 Tax=Allobranchiibius sp. GilTou73 TaxID=2904523 RepID=UPI001F20A98F|nr:hypothetical protein [Allobranchiibius sp. GilTou73]UIJ36278.1 hypothetical protein LVQ62_07910 [Allobranchiibius sp. GilTou73]
MAAGTAVASSRARGRGLLHPEPLKRPAFDVKAATVLRATRTAYREHLAHERMDPEALQTLQDQRAIAQASFAMQHSRFYRDLYRSAGFSIGDLRDPAAFCKLPTIGKEDVRERFADFRTDEAISANTALNVTGGSTGEPLRILRDVRVPARALEWQLFHWWGLDPSVDIAIVQRHTKSQKDRLRHAASWWPSVRFQLDAFRMNEETIGQFLAQWQSVEPSLLIGYAGAISEVAAELLARDIRVHQPRAVATTAAPLTDPQRATISEAFDAPVYDHYRSSEVPWIAGECAAHEGLHVFADVRKLELLDETGVPVAAGTVGDTVVTDLNNRVFPLIRYRLGDRTAAIDAPCACGVTLPRIQPISGRQTDALRLPGGQVVAGEGLAQIFSRHPGAVRQFQIHQISDRSVVLRCVSAHRPDSARDIQVVASNLRELLDHQVKVAVVLVDRIPHAGGKVRCVTSDAR